MIHHIGLSGGKDSCALWLWAIHQSGYALDTIRGSFCDTENEFPQVYAQIQILDAYGQAHGVKPIRILRSLGFFNLVLKKKLFPSAIKRFCTEHLKIIPTRQLFEEYQLEGHGVISHSGVRREESPERAVMEEWGDFSPGVRVRRPLLDWKLEQIWAIHRQHGLPINPLYFTGRQRVGCRLCVMSNKRDVRIAAKTTPWIIDEIRNWERQLTLAADNHKYKGYRSFFHSDTIPECQRSETYINDKGRVKVCTIDDVVRWATTVHGGKQQGFGFLFEQDDAHQPCMSGYCE
jgi:3'-phosphoadenosine 5'-phosphosulfate sulfotransferase (PAPS reductase)/FAD synthetase